MKISRKYEKVINELCDSGSLSVSGKDLDNFLGTNLYLKRLSKQNGYGSINLMLTDLGKKKKYQSNKYIIYR